MCHVSVVRGYVFLEARERETGRGQIVVACMAVALLCIHLAHAEPAHDTNATATAEEESTQRGTLVLGAAPIRIHQIRRVFA